MPIVNSTYVIDSVAQADGRRWVKETHIDHNGVKYYSEFLAADGFDYETCLAARAETIGADIDRKEAAVSEGKIGINYRKIRPDAFLDRFTFDEQLRMVQAEASDPVIKVFVNNAINVKRPYINLDHGMVQQALPYLVSKSYLDGATEAERAARATAILADGKLEEI